MNPETIWQCKTRLHCLKVNLQQGYNNKQKWERLKLTSTLRGNHNSKATYKRFKMAINYLIWFNNYSRIFITKYMLTNTMLKHHGFCSTYLF